LGQSGFGREDPEPLFLQIDGITHPLPQDMPRRDMAALIDGDLPDSGRVPESLLRAIVKAESAA
jgi:hypothetical protein